MWRVLFSYRLDGSIGDRTRPNTTILPPSGLFYFGMLQPAGDMQISATSSISIATISDGYITVQWPLYSECHDNETLLTLTLAA